MTAIVSRIGLTAIVLSLFVVAPLAWSQAAQDESTTAEKVLTEEQVQANDKALATVNDIRARLAMLEEKAGQSSGVAKTVYERRLKDSWSALLAAAITFADRIAGQTEEGYDVSAYRGEAEELLDKLPGEVRRNIGQIKISVDDISKPTMPAPEQLALDAKLFSATKERDKLYRTLLQALQLAERFGVPTEVDGPALREMLSERAEAQSVYLELSTEDAASLRFQSTRLPADEDLKSRLSVVQGRVQMIAKSLEETVRIMAILDMDTARFRQQVVKTTGEISSEVLDSRVIGALVKDWIDTAGEAIAKTAPTFLVKALTFLIIVYIFLLLGRLAQRLMTKGIDASGLKISRLLRRMAISTTRNLILLIGVLIALSQLGIAVGPLLAGLGVAGFILGFALQDTLSNFASGMMILLYRPFDVGDVVETGGVFGKVSHMSLVNTTILTFDNQTLVIPNNKIWGDVIKNVTAQKVRRVDMTFGISYSDDIPKAEAILRDILASHELVLEDPEPVVKLHTLGESSVDFITRPWTKSEDYWDVYWDVTREVKMRFDAEGVSIPFPQRDVHLFTQTAVDAGESSQPDHPPVDAGDSGPTSVAASPVESDAHT
ncbi:MAG: mechanosensitive ion channel family protein [Gammaproteobacteria bacterium]|nr:MAG: mechanosensitive ion channel family protein [Gammaproteobacteria bacterium]